MNPSCPEPRNFLPSSWPQRARALARLGVLAVLTTALATALLAGCGGGGGGGDGQDAGPPPPPPPPTNREPVAAFTAAASVVAGQPLVLDGSASSDADGDPLSHSWDFGEGRRGGGARIARIFDTPGTVAVTLTVTDGRGGSSRLTRNVSVTAAPAAIGQVDTVVVVRDLAGELLPGVAVRVVQGGAAAVTTGSTGRATLRTDRGVPLVLRLSREGFADQLKSLDLPAVAESGFVETVMLPREAPLTLASAAAGGTLNGKDGAQVVFAPGSIVDAAGNPVNGAVEVSITPLDVVERPLAFPGRFAGLRTDGRQGVLLSHGTMEVAMTAGGARVQLAPGRTARIDIPIYASLDMSGRAMAVGDRYPIWSLDERTGGWIEEGSGTVVAAAGSPSGFALRAEVSHFSWWNHDAFDEGGEVSPSCKVDTNLDGVAEDITLSGYCQMLGSPPGPTNAAGFGSGPGRAVALSAGGARPLNETRPPRLPTFVAETTVPVNGGRPLLLPANVDIVLRGSVGGGALTGSRVVRVGQGERQAVDIILYPSERIEGTRAVTLPFDGTFGQFVRGETDRITFAAAADGIYEVVVTRPTGSPLAAGVVVSLGGTELASGTVGSSGFSRVVNTPAAGTVTVAITATDNAPGTYRVQLRLVTASGCGTVQTLGLPSSTASVAVAASGLRCFDVALAADDVLEISTTGERNAQGTARLLAPGGAEVDSDTYDTTASDNILLRAAVATAGTYRLEIVNTRATAGTLDNLALARLTPTAVLNPGETSTVDVPDGARPDAWFVLKAPPGAPMALGVEAGVGDQQMQFWPGGAAVQQARDLALARVRNAPAASHTLLRVTKFASASPAHRYTVFNRAPDALTLDTDLTETLQPDRRVVRVFALDSSAAERISTAALPTGSVDFWLFDPAGNLVTSGPLGSVRQLVAAGTHTLLVARTGSTATTATVRVNRVTPIEVNLASPFVRNAPIALGEVLMLRTPVTQGQLVALALSSSAPLPLIARAPTSGAGSSLPLVLTVDSAGTGPVSGIGGPVYASSTGTADLFVQATGSTLATAQGPLSLTLSSPAAVPTAVGAAFTATAPPTSFAARGYSFPAPVRTLVCMTHTPAPIGTTQVRLFGNGAPPASYGGDMVFNLPSGESRLEQLGRTRVAGAHTLTIANVRGADVAGRLLVMEPPGAVAPGTAVPAQTLATPCDRRFFSFAATAGQSFTVRVTAGFAGTLYVRKQEAGGDWTARTGGTFVGSIDVPGSPASLSANTERVLSFSIPSTSALGTGTYIIEVDASDDATGGFSLSLSSP